MLQIQFQPVELIDQLGTLGDGMNAGVAPLLLKRNQMALAVNLTVRGTYAKTRPPFQIKTLTPNGTALIASALAGGPFQGACFYNPDSGSESLIVAIGGRLFQIFVTISPATVNEITPPLDPNPPTITQAWLWQAEEWVIWNDGVSNPVFFDGTSSVRSNYSNPIDFGATTTADFIAPAVGGVVSGVVLNSTGGLYIGALLTFKDIGQFKIQQIPAPNTVDLININATPGVTVPYDPGFPVKTVATWQQLGTQLPPGRMGVYGLGRNWICLPDGRSFIASDLVGGSSGTQDESYRNAVLEITENIYLAGGGAFFVPGSIGDITAIRFSETLDSSLGQGPLQVFTHSHIFSCQAPIDRLTWQDVTNPILTQSLISNGALGQNSTINANSDIFFRSPVGLASLILARREFNTWGNVPISREVDSILSGDNQALLQYGSAIIWDNRFLLTCKPSQSSKGVYSKALVVVNFDPISSLRGKEASIYDGVWTGLNVLQMVTGEFENVPRAFSFCLNLTTNAIELYELLKSETPAKDNGTRDIVMEFQSASIFNFPDGSAQSRELKSLADGELYVDMIPPGVTANFQAFYRPDQWPCWIPWRSWSECAGTTVSNMKPQFRPRMGLGEPSASVCDPATNRSMRLGYTFQFRLIYSNCRFLGAKFRATTVPQTMWAPVICTPICPPTVNPNRITTIVIGDTIIWGEWPGGLPASFSADQILNVLQDGDFPIGPRVELLSENTVAGHVDLEFPQTGQPTYRVTVVPAGSVHVAQLPVFPATTAVMLPSPGIPRQTNLNILGQLSDVYVLANPDPGPFLVSGNNQLRLVLNP